VEEDRQKFAKGILRHHELTEVILGTFYEVYNELGFGFLESVYENALVIALREKGLLIQQQVPIPVWFRGRIIGNFTADLIAANIVILELKAARSIDESHKSQLLNYLKATQIEVGLLLNFGHRPEFKRLAFDNQRKKTPMDKGGGSSILLDE
jgi:GxxExxY protein